MKKQHLVSLVQGDYTTVKVVFQKDNNRQVASAGNQYTYKVLRPAPEVGATAVVKVANSYALAKVVEVHKTPQLDFEVDYAYKWIVQVIDPTNYDLLVESERVFNSHLTELELNKQRDKLKKDLKQYLPVDDAKELFSDIKNTLLQNKSAKTNEQKSIT